MTNTAEFNDNIRGTARSPRAVITGGSGGIGCVIVRQLLDTGYEVLTLTRKPPEVTHERVRHIACDLSNAAQITAVGKAIVAEGIPVDVLIHCAGVIFPRSVATMEENDIQQQVDINFTAPVLLTSSLFSIVRDGGHIVFLNSLAAIFPLPESSVYAATKAALRSFALSLTIEAKPRRIAVSSIFPGAVDTAMLREEMSHGGSVLNFVNPPVSPESVAAVVMKAIQRNGGEYFRPELDGVFGRLCMFWPALLRCVLPIFTWVGRRGAGKYRGRAGVG
ncbi:SDR family NAD(P)-dependent oxidoreductase [Acetobacter conturbans]|uniref:SDR family NAD(P)-dependent oxidoreductase n=1 Tax=Acetobacter conturbans TaxID=1737472 RepID=A0ABX0JYB2_9PROT|nr:SDR family oxidoreductase [Acetobacter conturbans]NHN88502.1 SDR family NAD(P)-dependent oxidoreductase [Acetobacter conturbans]